MMMSLYMAQSLSTDKYCQCLQVNKFLYNLLLFYIVPLLYVTQEGQDES
jgi:hypothetical protein